MSTKRRAVTGQGEEALLSREAAGLARLSEASSRLWHTQDLREGLEEMLAATIELLGADKGAVQLLDADAGVLRIVGQRGFEADFLDFFREVAPEEHAACGRALRCGERIVIEDIEADAPFAPLRPMARAAGYRAVQSTPLLARDGTRLGMLSTHFREPHRPSEHELRLLDLYVRQAADFIERHRMEEALRASEAQLHVAKAAEVERQRLFQVLDGLPALVWLLTPNYRVAFANGAACGKFGEVRGRLCYEACFGLSAPCEFCETYRVLETGQPVHWEAHPNDGSVVEVHDFPFTDVDGSPMILEMGLDVTAQRRNEAELAQHREHLEELVAERTAELQTANTQLRVEMAERKQAEEALRESEAMLEAFFAASPGILNIEDEQFRYVKTDRTTPTYFGLTRETIIGRAVADLAPGFLEQFGPMMQRVLDTGEPEEAVTHSPVPDRPGEEVRWRAAYFPVPLPGGKRGIGIVGVEITDVVQAEVALRQSEARYRRTIETANEGILLSSPEGRLEFANQKMADVLGYSRAELTGMIGVDLMPDVDMERVRANRAKLAQHELIQDEFRFRRKDGTTLWTLCSIAPMFSEHGEYLGSLAMHTDITERKQAEETLRFQADVLAAINDAVVVVDLSYRITSWNAAAERIYGWRAEEVLGRPAEEVLHTELPPEERAEAYRKLEAGEPVLTESVQSTKDGRKLRVGGYTRPVRDTHGETVGYVAVNQDITARKQAEEAREQLLAAVEQERERLSTLINSIADEIWFADADQRVTLVNPAARKEFGAALGDTTEVERFAASLEVRRGDGTPRPVEEAPLLRALRGESITGEEELIRTPATGELRHRQVNAAPVRGADGAIIGSIAVTHDITERVQMEEALLAAERARAALAENLGGEIAHRVKNNLAMISGLMQMQLLQESDAHTTEALRDAIGRIRTFATLHEQMYASRTEEVDLLVALQRIGRTIGDLFPSWDKVAIEVLGDSFRCHARAATNLSVIANELITNALKHGGPDADGRRTIRVSLQQTSEGVTLSVWNSGAPVPEDLGPSQSQTMGLRLVQDMVDRYGGRFQLGSSEGGTRAEVVVPGEAIRKEAEHR